MRTVVWDKTGTLTAGKPAVVDYRVWAQGVAAADALLLAAAVEANSEHPLGSAIVSFTHALLAQQAPQQPRQQQELEPGSSGCGSGGLPACRDVEVTVGQGISAWVQLPPPPTSMDGGSSDPLQSRASLLAAAAAPAAPGTELDAGSSSAAAPPAEASSAAAAQLPATAAEVRVLVGSPALMAAAGLALPPGAERYMHDMQGLGRTCVLVALGGSVAAAVAIQDPLKSEAR